MEHQSAEACLEHDRAILLSEGPAAALHFLGTSEHKDSPVVRRALWAIAWTHQQNLGDVLDAEYLDSVWCQCDICHSTWMISPLHAEPGAAAKHPLAVSCPSCRRVLCGACGHAASERCSCGGAYVRLAEPNGRKRCKAPVTQSVDRYGWDPPPDRPIGNEPDLHRWFGIDGRVPIGIDRRFPRERVADASGYVAWARVLSEAGLHYHARQQLDLAGELADDRTRAQWLWLQARRDRVRLSHWQERSRRRLGGWTVRH